MKRISLIAFFLIFLSALCFAQQIKKPNTSGVFYPSSAKILAERIKQFLDWAEIGKPDQGKDILALISPHAGYDYSGGVAAFGFKAIKGKTFRSVIVIGPSHFVGFDGISVYPEGVWQTPLGNVPIDNDLAEALIQYHPKISFIQTAFSKEHSIEVELPFLQIVLDEFQIVPIVVGKLSYENCQILSQALLKITDDRKDILVVASTDMSHYHSYEEAVQIDNLTIEELKNFQTESLYEKLVTGECEFCGSAAVITVLLYAQARGASEIEILKYANSGDVTGDKQRVVGYLSAAIYGPEARRDEMTDQTEDMLNKQQQKRLLEIARQTIEQYLRTGKTAEFTEEDPLLLKKLGAFVTLHKHAQLRGCIGNIIGQTPLYLTVRDMAIEAAVADPRFPNVTTEELQDIEIEVSVLSEPKQVEDVNEIQMGTHGVIVKKGFASGVFLPQVATETGWDREQFLSNLCAHKAGLSPDAWKDKSTQLFSFTAQVFAEK